MAIIVGLAFGVGAIACVRMALTAFSGRDQFSDKGDGVIYLIFAMMLVVGVLIDIAAYRSATGPAFKLMKAEWTCSRSHVVRDDDGDYSVCDQYSRR